MPKTESRMMPLGTEAPSFSLPDCDGSTVNLRDFDDSPALVVAFICNHCPFVQLIAGELAAFGREVMDRGAAMVAINANDPVAQPADGPDRMAEEKAKRGYAFPYLFDADQSVAMAYGAACTPDFFVFDGDRRLVYRGRFDGSTPGNDVPVTGEDLRDAVDHVLKGQPLDGEQYPSLGCSIKWKAGDTPA